MKHCSHLGERSKFGWLAVWGLKPDWRSEWKYRRLGEVSTPGGGNAGRAPSLHRIMPWLYLTTEENHGKTSVRAAEKCLANHCRARFVWSTWPPASGGLHCSADTRRSRFTLRATGTNLGQSKYLPSCRTKGFPTSANLEHKLAVRTHMWSAKKRNTQILVNLLVTKVPRGIRNMAKTLEL